MKLAEVRLRQHARVLEWLSLLGCAAILVGAGAVWAHAWLTPTASAPGIEPVPSAAAGWAQWANVVLYATTTHLGKICRDDLLKLYT